MKKICAICGNEFEAIHPRYIVCGASCRRANKLEKKKQYGRRQRLIKRPLIRKTCASCGVTFDTTHTLLKLCSPECRKTHSRTKLQIWRNANREKVNINARSHYNPKKLRLWRIKNSTKALEWSRRNLQLNGPVSVKTQQFFLSLKLGQTTQQIQIMKTPSTVIQVPTAQEIVHAFDRLMKETKAVCGLLSIACDSNPKIFDEIIALDSRFNYNMLESMRRVGKSELYEELLFDPSPNSRRLLAFPPKQQQEIYTKPVKVVRQIDGKNIVEEKPFQKLSKHECALVLDESKKRVRTVEEQLGFIKTPEPRRSERYEIQGDKLIVLAKTEFTMVALEDILQRMKAKEIQKLATNSLVRS